MDDIVATVWTSGTTTTQLLELLNVVGRLVELEPQQKDLLDRVMRGPLLTTDELTQAGVIPVAAASRKPPPESEGAFEDDPDATDWIEKIVRGPPPRFVKHERR